MQLLRTQARYFALAAAVFGCVGLSVGTTAAAAALNLSFAASSDGASAGWSAGKGSAIDLTVGNNSATTFAVITLMHVSGTPVSSLSEPTFITNNYGAGSPRWYITLSNNDTLWGYPPNANLSTTSVFAWAINNGSSYEPWSAVQTEESGATVTGAYVVADGDQPSGATDVITGLTFNGHYYN